MRRDIVDPLRIDIDGTTVNQRPAVVAPRFHHCTSFGVLVAAGLVGFYFLDRAARKGLIHRNAAARQKSKLAKAK